ATGGSSCSRCGGVWLSLIACWRRGLAGWPASIRGIVRGATWAEQPLADTPAAGMGLARPARSARTRMAAMTIGIDPGVLVVGAGPTGLAAAIELARRGERVS